MMKFKLMQTQYSANMDRIVEVVEIGDFKSHQLAVDFVIKRGYVEQSQKQRWVQIYDTDGRYPVELVKIDVNPFSLRDVDLK